MKHKWCKENYVDGCMRNGRRGRTWPKIWIWKLRWIRREYDEEICSLCLREGDGDGKQMLLNVRKQEIGDLHLYAVNCEV
jgi:hypothetical protein